MTTMTPVSRTLDMNWAAFDQARGTHPRQKAAAPVGPVIPLTPAAQAQLKIVQREAGLPQTGVLDAATIAYVKAQYNTQTTGSGSSGGGGSGGGGSSSSTSTASAAKKAAAKKAAKAKKIASARKKAAAAQLSATKHIASSVKKEQAALAAASYKAQTSHSPAVRAAAAARAQQIATQLAARGAVRDTRQASHDEAELKAALHNAKTAPTPALRQAAKARAAELRARLASRSGRSSRQAVAAQRKANKRATATKLTAANRAKAKAAKKAKLAPISNDWRVKSVGHKATTFALSNDDDSEHHRVDLAAVDGHHVPGTAYHYRHDWIPLVGAKVGSAKELSWLHNGAKITNPKNGLVLEKVSAGNWKMVKAPSSKIGTKVLQKNIPYGQFVHGINKNTVIPKAKPSAVTALPNQPINAVKAAGLPIGSKVHAGQFASFTKTSFGQWTSDSSGATYDEATMDWVSGNLLYGPQPDEDVLTGKKALHQMVAHPKLKVHQTITEGLLQFAPIDSHIGFSGDGMSTDMVKTAPGTYKDVLTGQIYHDGDFSEGQKFKYYGPAHPEPKLTPKSTYASYYESVTKAQLIGAPVGSMVDVTFTQGGMPKIYTLHKTGIDQWTSPGLSNSTTANAAALASPVNLKLPPDSSFKDLQATDVLKKLDALPIGNVAEVVDKDGVGQDYKKSSPGMWVGQTHDDMVSSTQLADSVSTGQITVTPKKTVLTSGIAYPQELITAPVGTTVKTGSGTMFQKAPYGSWYKVDENGPITSAGQFSITGVTTAGYGSALNYVKAPESSSSYGVTKSMFPKLPGDYIGSPKLTPKEVDESAPFVPGQQALFGSPLLDVGRMKTDDSDESLNVHTANPSELFDDAGISANNEKAKQETQADLLKILENRVPADPKEVENWWDEWNNNFGSITDVKPPTAFYQDENGRYQPVYSDVNILKAGDYPHPLLERGTKKYRTALIANMIDVGVHSWAVSSNDTNPMTLAMHHAVAQKFGIPKDQVFPWNDEKGTTAKDFFDANQKFLDLFVTAQYENTQVHLRKAGIKNYKVFRGQNQMPHRLKDGGWLMRPLASWSTDKGTSTGFGSNTLVTVVPIEKIFSVGGTGYGCRNEFEVVMIGGNVRAKVLEY